MAQLLAAMGTKEGMSAILGSGGSGGTMTPAQFTPITAQQQGQNKSEPVSGEAMKSSSNQVALNPVQQQAFSTIFQQPQSIDPTSAWEEYRRKNSEQPW